VADEAPVSCARPGQISACDELGDGDLCVSQGKAGVCQFGLCLAGCGDGAVDERTEECEGADFGGQSCADFSFYGGDLSCTSACEIDTGTCEGACGDGLINGPELCDTGLEVAGSCVDIGFDRGHATCRGDCLSFAQACHTIGLNLFPGAPGTGIAEVHSVSGTGRDDVYVSTTDGSVYHYDGGRWTVEFAVPGDPLRLWIRDPGWGVAVSASGVFMERRDGVWIQRSEQGPAAIHKLWAAGPDQIYAGTPGGLLKFDGSQWLTLNEGTVTYYSVWGRNANDVYVAGLQSPGLNAVLGHWDGSQFRIVESRPGIGISVSGD
jgi:hypothetical protein